MISPHTYRLPAAMVRPGPCGLCRKPTTLRWYDQTDHTHLGDCCLYDMNFAARVLDEIGPRIGVRPPTAQDSMPNH